MLPECPSDNSICNILRCALVYAKVSDWSSIKKKKKKSMRPTVSITKKVEGTKTLERTQASETDGPESLLAQGA